MPISTESLNRKLFKVLSKYKPKPLDTSGEVTPVEDEADVIKFKFTKDGVEYGEVFATIDDNHALTLYYGDDVADSPSARTKGLDYNDSWEGLLEFLSRWAHDNRLKWNPDNNKDHLVQDMARRKHMKKKENIGEGYYPMGKKASYSDNIPTVKIVIEHTRQIEEGEQRYRNINKIFLENQLGERFLLDTKKPGVARVYARHVAEGGKVNDERWGHISSLCEEYNKMAGFVRATRNGQFNESAQKLVESGIQHYQSLRETLSRMTGKRGYNMYFESWTPALMEDEVEEANLNELFVQETLDPRIESVMPILSKLHKQVSEMKETIDLAEWADSLIEGGDGGEASEEPVFTEPVETLPTDGADAPEDDLDEGLGDVAKKVGSALKKVGSKALDTLGHGSDEELLKDLQRRAGVPASAQHGKPSMAKTNEEESIKSNNPIGIPEEDIDESALQAYLGDKKYGKDGMDALRKAGQEHASEKKMQNIRAKFSNKEKEVDEGLDANQKRVGQLGPTEPVGKNEKNLRGKLVGANENFINTDVQAVVSEGEGDFAKALSTISGWYEDESSNPNIRVYHYDDREGGYYADGEILHNLKTGEIKINYHDSYGGDEIDGVFNSVGDAMNALRGGYPASHGSKAPNYDKLGGRTLAGPDDLYKTDKKGRKGSLIKSRMDAMKANSPYRISGPKGVLPEGQEDLDAILRIIRK